MASKRKRRARAKHQRTPPAPVSRSGGVQLPPLPELVELAQAAAALGVSVSALRQRERAGMLRLERDRDGWVRVRRKVLARHAREYSPRPGGRPAVLEPELLARIAAMRRQGMTLEAIAKQLTREGVPTARGGLRWWPSSVSWALWRGRAPTP